jgi:hypothetical protein
VHAFGVEEPAKGGACCRNTASLAVLAVGSASAAVPQLSFSVAVSPYTGGTATAPVTLTLNPRRRWTCSAARSGQACRHRRRARRRVSYGLRVAAGGGGPAGTRSRCWGQGRSAHGLSCRDGVIAPRNWLCWQRRRVRLGCSRSVTVGSSSGELGAIVVGNIRCGCRVGESGLSTTAVGDVNGDGRADLLADSRCWAIRSPAGVLHDRDVRPDRHASSPLQTPKPREFRGFGTSGETRTRTGDTTIFRRSRAPL